jgi:hypothetical protein
MDMLQQEITNHPDTTLAERRTVSRIPVIKSAKIFVGPVSSQSIFNCLILDESKTGVLIDMGTLVNVPEEVTLQMGSGATYQARRRWSVGTKAGLEFIGAQVMTTETSVRMGRIADVLQRQGVVAAVATLRAARFFDHEELRQIAEAAEAATQRLEAVLTGHQPI